MPAHDLEVEEEAEGILMKWLSTIKRADEGKLVVEKMELDETGFPAHGEVEELEADSPCSRWARRPTSLLDGIPGRGRGRGQGRHQHDDWPPGSSPGATWVPAERP